MVIVRKLEYLVALARERHFARAAAACQVSQPTLSAAIQQLEIDLGVTIIRRGRRFEGFTPAGELVLAWAQRMTAEADRLQDRLMEQQQNSPETLRIGLIGSSVPVVKTFTVPFQRRYPKVNLRIIVQSAFDIQQAIEEGSIDVGITYLDQDAKRYGRSQLLYTEEYELLIRRGTRFSGQPSVPWEALKEVPLCLLIPNTNMFGAEESEILSEALRNTPHIITTAVWLVMDHVRSGKWASVLPRPVRIMIAEDSELEAIPLPPTGAPASVGIVLPRTEPKSAPAEAFFEIAKSSESLKTLARLLHSPAKPRVRGLHKLK